MSLIEIKNSVETFATIDSPDGYIQLNIKNKLVDDHIFIQSNIEEWNGDIYIPPKIIGGRIFYDNGNNGAIYTFYDADMQEITYTNVASLANAVYYTVSGTPTKDRFYVYDNTTHTTGGKTATDGFVSSIYWGYYNITTGATANTIGSGKTNTQTILGITDTSSYSNSIFKYIKACNDANLNGNSDWYIGSKAEQDKLRTSGLVDWYSNKYIWSAVESSSYNAYYWYYYYSDWSNGTKYSSSYGCFAQRSF